MQYGGKTVWPRCWKKIFLRDKLLLQVIQKRITHSFHFRNVSSNVHFCGNLVTTFGCSSSNLRLSSPFWLLSEAFSQISIYFSSAHPQVPISISAHLTKHPCNHSNKPQTILNPCFALHCWQFKRTSHFWVSIVAFYDFCEFQSVQKWIVELPWIFSPVSTTHEQRMFLPDWKNLC